MGSRVLLAAKAAVSKAVDRMADPRESLDHTYQRQAEQLARLQRRVAEVAPDRGDIHGALIDPGSFGRTWWRRLAQR